MIKLDLLTAFLVHATLLRSRDFSESERKWKRHFYELHRRLCVLVRFPLGASLKSSDDCYDFNERVKRESGTLDLQS